LHLSESEMAEAKSLLAAARIPEAFFVISLGAKVSAKDWTQPNWLRLLEQLAQRHPRLGCVAIGARDERDRTDECLRQWHGPRLNLCGVSAPRKSAAVLRLSRLFVGHDSGPMHLAAAVGTPCIAIFAARTPPGQWFPLGHEHAVIYHRTECAGCGLEECVLERKRCILSITVEEVLSAVLNRLEMAAAADARHN